MLGRDLTVYHIPNIYFPYYDHKGRNLRIINTLLDGELVRKPEGICFYATDIIYHNASSCISASYEQRFEILKTIETAKALFHKEVRGYPFALEPFAFGVRDQRQQTRAPFVAAASSILLKKGLPLTPILDAHPLTTTTLTVESASTLTTNTNMTAPQAEACAVAMGSVTPSYDIIVLICE